MAAEKRRTGNNGDTAGSVCRECPAPCCRDITMLITRPRSRTEINEIAQYLHFDTATVFIRNGKWYLTFAGTCIYLSRDNLCRKYTTRPARCRRHNPPDCERFAPWYDMLISTPEEFEEYLRSAGSRKRSETAVKRRIPR